MFKKKVAVVIVGVALVTGGGVYIYFQHKNANKPNVDVSKLNTTTSVDFEVPNIDDITKQYSDVNERYQAFMQYAYLKQTAGKFDIAQQYYEAAATLNVAKDLQQQAQYQLYIIAAGAGDSKKAEYYFKLLGDDFFSKFSKSSRDE